MKRIDRVPMKRIETRWERKRAWMTPNKLAVIFFLLVLLFFLACILFTLFSGPHADPPNWDAV